MTEQDQTKKATNKTVREGKYEIENIRYDLKETIKDV